MHLIVLALVLSQEWGFAASTQRHGCSSERHRDSSERRRNPSHGNEEARNGSIQHGARMHTVGMGGRGPC